METINFQDTENYKNDSVIYLNNHSFLCNEFGLISEGITLKDYMED